MANDRHTAVAGELLKKAGYTGDLMRLAESLPPETIAQFDKLLNRKEPSVGPGMDSGIVVAYKSGEVVQDRPMQGNFSKEGIAVYEDGGAVSPELQYSPVNQRIPTRPEAREMIELGYSVLPFFGEASDFIEGVSDVRRGNYPGAILSGIGFALPFVPAKALKKATGLAQEKATGLAREKLDDFFLNMGEEGAGMEFPEVFSGVDRYVMDVEFQGLNDALRSVEYPEYQEVLRANLNRLFPEGAIPVKRVEGYGRGPDVVQDTKYFEIQPEDVVFAGSESEKELIIDGAKYGYDRMVSVRMEEPPLPQNYQDGGAVEPRSADPEAEILAILDLLDEENRKPEREKDPERIEELYSRLTELQAMSPPPVALELSDDVYLRPQFDARFGIGESSRRVPFGPGNTVKIENEHRSGVGRLGAEFGFPGFSGNDRISGGVTGTYDYYKTLLPDEFGGPSDPRFTEGVVLRNYDVRYSSGPHTFSGNVTPRQEGVSRDAPGGRSVLNLGYTYSTPKASYSVETIPFGRSVVTNQKTGDTEDEWSIMGRYTTRF